MQGILVCVVTEIVVVTPRMTLSLTAFLILQCKDRGSEVIGPTDRSWGGDLQAGGFGGVLTKTPIKEWGEERGSKRLGFCSKFPLVIGWKLFLRRNWGSSLWPTATSRGDLGFGSGISNSVTSDHFFPLIFFECIDWTISFLAAHLNLPGVPFSLKPLHYSLLIRLH